MTDIKAGGEMAMTCAAPDHQHSPQDACRGCYSACQAELTALNDRYMRLLGERREFEKRTEASARRQAGDHVRAFIHLVLPGLLAENGDVAEVSRTVGRASMVDPEWGRTQHARDQLGELKRAGERAVRLWYGRLRAVQVQFEADPREAEITRLRTVIEEQGRALHHQYAPPADGFTACACPGCELIRAMDVTERAEVPAP